jgi:peptidyl-prolyl cis-trans isomerase B (cyclophilin B)
MKRVCLWCVLGLVAGVLAACKAPPQEIALINTSLGEMVVEFWPDVAPKTVENFKKLARSGFYDGTAFHRLVKGFILQGGDPLSKTPNQPTIGTGGPGYSIKPEFNARPHVRGVISMAHSQQDPNSGSQFFLCLGEAKDLDGKYTAFGKLIKGDEVLAKIEATPVAPTTARDEMSRPLVRLAVQSVRILPAPSIK